MITLIITILVLVAVFFLQKWNPLLAGFLAVIPIKILGTGFMALETSMSNLQKAIEGMLIGQFLWGFVLLAVYFWMK